MKKFLKGSLAVLAFFMIVGACSAIFSTEEEETITEPVNEPVEEVEAPVEETVEEPVVEEPEVVEEPVEEPKEEVKEEPQLTLSQQNAIEQAKSYLDYTSFSKKGLIEQLEYEGFSTEDATFAVDNIEVDWREQAVLTAKSYLDYTSFSKQGLIEQLVYEGHSQEDAAYAVTQVGF
ncbi:Ltp family lipoprotein [Metabacillus sp. Hm71]|uniref:Ltp family lipoprotein n=1 Tax=Metabacillus sp. Hm71 TaxID=3450743 RepID=UPI003F42964D